MIDRSSWRAEIRSRMQEDIRSWALEIEDGWKDLVCDLIDAIEAKLGTRLDIGQIKEKFAGLRFYVGFDGSDAVVDEIEKLIAAAEAASFAICERCGASGKQQAKSGCLKTVCDTCLAAWLKEPRFHSGNRPGKRL